MILSELLSQGGNGLIKHLSVCRVDGGLTVGASPRQSHFQGLPAGAPRGLFRGDRGTRGRGRCCGTIFLLRLDRLAFPSTRHQGFSGSTAYNNWKE